LNVNTEQLQAYIEAFHCALESTAADYLPQDYRRQLLHAALLPARITGYVSTQFGVAVEYESAAETSLEVVRGSARVEDLIVRAPAAVRDTGPMLKISGANTTVASLTLEGAFPFRLASPDASVALRDVVFRAGPWRWAVQFAEVSSNRSAEHWSVAWAESRAKDEVLAAIVQVRLAAERKIPVSEYIEKFKQKTVLLLGDYDEAGLRRLASLSTVLSSLGYEPLLMKDVPDHPQQDLPQKVVAIGAIARFIVVDDSSKSGHLLEVQLCKQNSWVTVLLRAGGKGGSWMTAGAAHASSVIRELAYDPASPDVAVAEAAKWAEAKLKELERKFEGTYPWRAGS
jgi:hypothetical protein